MNPISSEAQLSTTTACSSTLTKIVSSSDDNPSLVHLQRVPNYGGVSLKLREKCDYRRVDTVTDRKTDVTDVSDFTIYPSIRCTSNGTDVTDNRR